jgi:hypothetical protein
MTATCEAVATPHKTARDHDHGRDGCDRNRDTRQAGRRRVLDGLARPRDAEDPVGAKVRRHGERGAHPQRQEERQHERDREQVVERLVERQGPAANSC